MKEIKINLKNLGKEITDTTLSFDREITLEQAGRIIEYIAQMEVLEAKRKESKLNL